MLQKSHEPAQSCSGSPSVALAAETRADKKFPSLTSMILQLQTRADEFGDFRTSPVWWRGYHKLSRGPQLFLILRAVQQAVVDLSTEKNISHRRSLRQQDAWMEMSLTKASQNHLQTCACDQKSKDIYIYSVCVFIYYLFIIYLFIYSFIYLFIDTVYIYHLISH